MNSRSDEEPDDDPGASRRKPYQPPRLTFLGNLVDVVRAGGGKVSLLAPDGPDVRKPPGK